MSAWLAVLIGHRERLASTERGGNYGQGSTGIEKKGTRCQERVERRIFGGAKQDSSQKRRKRAGEVAAVHPEGDRRHREHRFVVERKAVGTLEVKPPDMGARKETLPKR